MIFAPFPTLIEGCAGCNASYLLIEICSPMGEGLYPTPDGEHQLYGQIGVNQFFAIRGGGSNHNPAGVDDRGAATKPQVIVFPDTIRRNHISLVFDRARLREHTKMFVPWKWPGRRNEESADVLLGN